MFIRYICINLCKMLGCFGIISKKKLYKLKSKYNKDYFLIAESQFFDKRWYLKKNPDVANAGVDPVEHYLKNGWKESRNPSSLFDGNEYLRTNTDVRKSGLNPLVHYLRFGRIEGRIINDSHKKIYLDLPYVKSKSNLLYLETSIIDERINLLDECYSAIDDKSSFIVSLTSFPDRIESVKYTIFSLFQQSRKPKKIILFLAEEQFPHKEEDLPQTLLDFRKFGLEICWTHDTRSYKKIIPTLELYPNHCIVTVDDDIFYLEDFLEGLWTRHLEYPACVIADRCHYILDRDKEILPYTKWDHEVCSGLAKYRNLATGCSGILYPPGCFHSDVTNEKLFMELCPFADDIWLWGMAVLNGTKILAPDKKSPLIYTNLDRELGLDGSFRLATENVLNGKNDEQFARLLTAYPQLSEMIFRESYVKVSIIIPVYNAELYIAHCLDSMLAQTLKEIQIICVNDGSSDNSEKILSDYVAKDPRIIVINQQNRGQSEARNAGMRIAEGEFIGFCDNDDWVSPNFFEILYNAAKKQGTPIAATPNVFYVDPEDGSLSLKPVGIDQNVSETVDLERIAVTTGVQWNKIYQQSFLKKHHIICTNIRVAAEDNYFTFQAMMYSSSIAVDNAAKYYFYRRANATSNLVKTKKDFCVIDLYKSINDLIDKAQLSEKDKSNWHVALQRRMDMDFSVFYNEMVEDSKDDFASLVLSTFPHTKLTKR